MPVLVMSKTIVTIRGHPNEKKIILNIKITEEKMYIFVVSFPSPTFSLTPALDSFSLFLACNDLCGI